MSEWHDAEVDEMDFDLLQKEVSILVKSGYQGNIYLCISFDQIKTISDEIKAKEGMMTDTKGPTPSDLFEERRRDGN